MSASDARVREKSRATTFLSASEERGNGITVFLKNGSEGWVCCARSGKNTRLGKACGVVLWQFSVCVLGCRICTIEIYVEKYSLGAGGNVFEKRMRYGKLKIHLGSQKSFCFCLRLFRHNI